MTIAQRCWRGSVAVWQCGSRGSWNSGRSSFQGPHFGSDDMLGTDSCIHEYHIKQHIII